MSLENVEQKNVNRASALVVRTERAKERTLREIAAKQEQVKEEQARHAALMKQYEQELKTFAEVLAEIEEDLQEAREYLKELTKI